MNRPPSKCSLRKATAVAAVAGLLNTGILCAPQTAHAYQEDTHQALVDLAFQVMRTVQYEALPNSPSLFADQSSVPAALKTPPAGVSATEWNALISAIPGAVRRWNSASSGIPNSALNACGMQVATLGSVSVAPENSLLHGLRSTRSVEPGSWDCDLEPNYLPHGKDGSFQSLYNMLHARLGWYGRYTGATLGTHAADPDYYLDEWRAMWKITNMQPHWMQQSKNFAQDAAQFGVAMAIMPFVCGWRMLKGDSCSMDEIDRMVEEIDPVVHLEAAIPGIPANGDFLAGLSTGMGHFITVVPTVVEPEYDDLRGLWFLEAGGKKLGHGAADTSVMTAFDLMGITVDYDRADGPHTYQFVGRTEDGHPNKSSYTRRGKWEWTRQGLGQTVFTPLDNMAYYGWREFMEPRGSIDTGALARPLHALGDVAAPHHLTGSLGWGHRPYEFKVEMDWERMRLNPTAESGVTRAQQYEQSRRILKEALRWRKYILDWRAQRVAAMGGASAIDTAEEFRRARDIPIRDMITQMAKENLAWIEARGNFPYDDVASTKFHTGGDEGVSASDSWGTEHFNDSIADMRGLVERATGGILAFLVSSSELIGEPANPTISKITAKIGNFTLTPDARGVHAFTTAAESATLTLQAQITDGASNQTVTWYRLNGASETYVGTGLSISVTVPAGQSTLYRADLRLGSQPATSTLVVDIKPTFVPVL